MYRQPTEHETQTAILDLCAAEGIFAFRLNTATQFGMYQKKDGKTSRWKLEAHSLGPGAADIRIDLVVQRKCTAPSCLVQNLLSVPTWVEVKKPGGEQSALQKVFQSWVESKGHIYLLITSIDQFREWLKGMRNGNP